MDHPAITIHSQYIIQMADIEYRNHSISQLVNELNTLGSLEAVLRQANLIAIHPKDHQTIRRFRNSHAQQFFLTDNSKKKYFYEQILNEIDSITVNNIANNIFEGFNVTIVMENIQSNKQMMKIFELFFNSLEEPIGVIHDFYQNEVIDVIGNQKLKFQSLQSSEKYYKFTNSIQLSEYFPKSAQKQMRQTIRIVKLKDSKIHDKQMEDTHRQMHIKGEIRFILLPNAFLSSNNVSNIHLSTVKNQLTQIFNYIKVNPKKRYEQISKVITKRHPLTTYLTTLILHESANYVLNWISGENLEYSLGKFEFYDKLHGISNLLKRSSIQKQPIILERINKKDHGKSSISPHRTEDQNKEKEKDKKTLSKTDSRSPINKLESQMSQLEYCRSLQRKTHKYSVFNGEEQQYSEPEGLFDPKHEKISKFSIENEQKEKEKDCGNNQSEKISILKAQHAIEVSQYHQTIQNLNKKIIALTNQKGLQQLYTIHQRQIMLLELKITELRKDISIITNAEDQKSLKGIIKKLNQEIKKIQSKTTNNKISNGKMIILQKQLKQQQKKYQQSEKARKKLNFQLQAATKRLKMRDHQMEIINKEQQKRIQQKQHGQLSYKDQQIMKQVQILLNGVKSGKESSMQYLLRKVNNILAELSKSRTIILECNDFLIQLQDHIESRLGDKDADVVLDCNRFIRGFLIDNLSIL